MRPIPPSSFLQSHRRLRAGFGFAQAMLSGLLLLALIVAGSVPEGMMRVADGSGLRLVLCTPEGPREIWMDAKGVAHDRAPLPDQNHETGKCLSVTMAFAAVQSDLGTLAEPAHFDRFRPDLTAPRPATAPPQHRPQPRAPPVFRLS
ncbi:hypothetical protein RYZ20_04615 [Thioclava sp. A2]|nr:hypothetical protein [Thioclava sp. A2]